MADIILYNDQDQEQTLTGVSKLVTRSTDGEAVFSAGGQGGGNIDFGLTVGETYEEAIYFNTVHDTGALDAALASADYPNALTINGTAYPSNTLFSFKDTLKDDNVLRLDIVNLSSIHPGAYAIWRVDRFFDQAEYCTTSVELSGGTSISKGWAWPGVTFSIFNKGILTSILDTFAEVKDMYFSSSPQAYGDFLSKSPTPRITFVPTGGDIQFELNAKTTGSNGAVVTARDFSADKYTHEVATLLDGKLQVVALPNTTWEENDGSTHIESSWEYATDTGLIGMAEYGVDAENNLTCVTTAAKIRNNSAASVKFSCTWSTEYVDHFQIVYTGVSQIGANVRQPKDGTQGPYTLTQTLSAGESLILAVTSGTPAETVQDISYGRISIKFTDFAEIT